MRLWRLLTYLCMACSLFLWVPDTHLTLQLRVGFLYAAGLGALCVLISSGRKKIFRLHNLGLVGLFVGVSSMALLVHSPLRDALLGRPLLHPGVLSLWASVLCGYFWLQEQQKTPVLTVFYGFASVWGVLNLLMQSSSERLGALGVQVHYASFLWLLAMLIGWWLFDQALSHRRLILGTQFFLLCCIILSGTRLTIVLALLTTLFYVVFAHRNRRSLHVVFAVGLGASIALVTLTSNRLTDASYLAESISFRKSLVVAALPLSVPDLMFGGGIGAIETAISQNSASSPLLAASFAEGWIYESSHNYLIDLVVERGLIAALVFVLLVIVALNNAFRVRSDDTRIHAAIVVVCIVYILGNNINVQVEMILWMALLPLLSLRSARAIHIYSG